MQLSRRLLLISGLLGAGGVLTGCSASDRESETSVAAPAGSAFPVTITHKYGTTEIPSAPQRIVSVGLTEQDALLALGVKPLAVTEWYGEQPFATWPWATSLLGDAKPTVLNNSDGIPLEQIAALKPDLILGTNAGLTKEDYEKLSAFAPTIANSGTYDSDYFEPWPEQTLQIGTAVGLKAEAEALIAAVQKKFSDTAAAHPEFAGTPTIFLQAPFYEGKAIAYQNGLGTAFLTDLGFTVPSEIDAYETEGAQASIPLEKLDVLNAADVLIWATEDDKAKAEMEKEKLFTNLEAVKGGTSVYTGGELAGAIYFSTVLSLPYVIDTLVPQLTEVLQS